MLIRIKATKPQADFHAMRCKYPAFVAGFGTGKSQAMIDSALLDSLEGGSASTIALYEPTYDLVRLILAPRLTQALTDWGVPHKYNKAENIVYTSSGQMGDFILRTLDNPARIVGYESFRAKIDELDTLKREHAAEAWQKVIARNRQKPSTYRDTSGKPMNTVSVFTTPEGFRFVYDRWSANPGDGYQFIQASTKSNPFLPPDYIDGLRASYPAQLIDAYIDGQFVNLTSGAVYHQFSRQLNHSDERWDGREALHIGMDFNVGHMAAVVYVIRDGDPIAVDEIIDAYDTPDIIGKIQRRYWDDGRKCSIAVYPDASGNARKSVGASVTDHALLRQAGFTVIVDGANPSIRDRVNAMNAMICNAKGERRYKINTHQCPQTTACLEQQAYDKHGEPDKSSGKDHPADAAGYPICKLFPIRKPVSHIPVAFAL